MARHERRRRTTHHRTAGAALTAVTAASLAGTALLALPAQASAPAGTAGPTSRSQAVARADHARSTHPAAVAQSGADAFTVRSVSTDPDGASHVHYDRTYHGLPVVGGDVVVHTDGAGAFTGATNPLRAPLTVGTSPAVSGEQAQATGSQRAATAEPGTRPQGSSRQLVVDALGASPALAWAVRNDGVRADGAPSHRVTLVDARTGKVLDSYELYQEADTTGRGYQVGTVTVQTDTATGGWQLKDSTRGGNQTRDLNNTSPSTLPAGSGSAIVSTTGTFGDGTLSNRQTVGVDAYYGIAKTWDYYKATFGRSGIRGDGAGSTSYVHYGVNYANAGWDDSCFCMIYGDGGTGQKPFTAIDVAGHEMTHGVTSNTAGLVYSGESGGLNESTSDVFGTAVEFYANNPTDTPDYLIGEKLGSSPLRWMDQPSKDGASADCWSSTVGSKDVHYSSGVGNHAFFLMAAGSGAKTINGVSYNSPTCNGSTVTGVGIDAAARVWYRALTTYMTSSTNYSGARTAMVKAAADLYGASSTQCQQVEKAWIAVSASSTTTCASLGGGGGGGGGGNLVANPGFESGATSWTASSGVITNSTGGTPHAGSYYAWLDGYGSTHTDTLSQTVTIPAGSSASLSFYLWVSSDETTTSTAYDTLKVQVVNGSTTTTLATYSNLNKGSGYVQRTLSMTPYLGKTVTIKLTGSEDSSLATSFLADDFSLTAS